MEGGFKEIWQILAIEYLNCRDIHYLWRFHFITGNFHGMNKVCLCYADDIVAVQSFVDVPSKLNTHTLKMSTSNEIKRITKRIESGTM